MGLRFIFFSNHDHPGKPVDLMEELEVNLTVLDKVGGEDDDEESCRNIEVEGYVHHHNQHTSNLQFRAY